MRKKGEIFKSVLYLIVDGLRLEADGVEEEVVSLDGGHALRVRLVALADLAVLLLSMTDFINKVIRIIIY